MPRRPGMRLVFKIPLIVVAAALVSGFVVSATDYNRAAMELRRTAEAKLSALLDARRVAIDDYLESIRRDLASQAASPFVMEAYRGFQVGIDELGEDALVRLRELYVDANPFPDGSRELLDRANDRSIYSLAHARFHRKLRDFVARYGYRDLLLLDRGGNVVYSVMKWDDFATAVGGAGLPANGLSRVVETAATAAVGAQAFSDFELYGPAGGRPTGFVAEALRDEVGAVVGTVALAMPIQRIDRVMQVAAGLGATGEAFLVGGDLFMRNNSRFADQPTILRRRVVGGAVQKALAG